MAALRCLASFLSASTRFERCAERCALVNMTQTHKHMHAVVENKRDVKYGASAHTWHNPPFVAGLLQQLLASTTLFLRCPTKHAATRTRTSAWAWSLLPDHTETNCDVSQPNNTLGKLWTAFVFKQTRCPANSVVLTEGTFSCRQKKYTAKECRPQFFFPQPPNESQHSSVPTTTAPHSHCPSSVVLGLAQFQASALHSALKHSESTTRKVQRPDLSASHRCIHLSIASRHCLHPFQLLAPLC